MSYSNNRQQAVVMCHASRAEADRARTIELYHQFIRVMERASNATQADYERMIQFSDEQRKFVQAERALRDQFVEETAASIDTVRDRAISGFDNLLQRMGNQMDGLYEVMNY